MMLEFIKKNKKYIKETLLLLLGGVIINLACFLMGTIYSHAQTLDTPGYPYYINEIYGASGTYGNQTIETDDVNGVYHKYFQSQEEQIKNFLYQQGVTTSDVVIIRVNEVYNGVNVGTGYFKLGLWAYINPTNTVNLVDNATLVNSSVRITAEKVIKVDVSYYLSSNTFAISSSGTLTTGIALNYNFFGTPSIYHFNASRNGVTYEGYQIYNYPLLMMGTNAYYTSNNIPVIAYTGVSIGDFTNLPGLDSILNNIQNTWEPPSNITGHALPSQPTENPNNNDFQNRLQMFEYLKDSINAIVGNLGYNIKNWFDNLIGKLVEGFNSVSQNIYNGFKTLMDNIKDFFGAKIDAIIDKFNYIFEPLSTQELSDNLNNSNFSSDFLGLTTTISTFGTAFTSGSEPSSCSFTLDFSNSYYNFGVCEFSLDWILPFRSGIRLIVGCLCVYSLIVSIFTSLNTYIGGTSSINDDI